MKKITSFNKTNLAEVRKEIEAKLDELKDLGINISLGTISFDSDSFKARLSCDIINSDLNGINSTIYSKEFYKYFMISQYPNAIDKEVKFGGLTYTFLGFKPNARTKKAIIGRNGTTYRVEFYSIESQLI
ncbi:MAG: hypothetical protein PHF21_03300 [Bacilli bacterium]|nr:hypothetical protein [Bacilli bacterium]